MKKVHNHEQRVSENSSPLEESSTTRKSHDSSKSSSSSKTNTSRSNNDALISPSQEEILIKSSCNTRIIPDKMNEPPETLRTISNNISTKDKGSSGSPSRCNKNSMKSTKTTTSEDGYNNDGSSSSSSGAGAFYILRRDKEDEGRKPLLFKKDISKSNSNNKESRRKAAVLGVDEDGGRSDLVGSLYTTAAEDQKKKKTNKKNNYPEESPSSSSCFSSCSSLYSLLPILVKFFLILSVSGLLLATLLWFHVRLTTLEEQLGRRIYSQTDKLRIQPVERDAQESEQQHHEFQYQQGVFQDPATFHFSNHKTTPTTGGLLSPIQTDEVRRNERVMSLSQRDYLHPGSLGTSTTDPSSSSSWSEGHGQKVRVSALSICYL
jgi:hypothetical protein